MYHREKNKAIELIHHGTDSRVGGTPQNVCKLASINHRTEVISETQQALKAVKSSYGNVKRLCGEF